MSHPSPASNAKPANPVLVEWLVKQYDQPQQVHCGPEALAWDMQGLQQATILLPSLK